MSTAVNVDLAGIALFYIEANTKHHNIATNNIIVTHLKHDIYMNSGTAPVSTIHFLYKSVCFVNETLKNTNLVPIMSITSSTKDSSYNVT